MSSQCKCHTVKFKARSTSSPGARTWLRTALQRGELRDLLVILEILTTVVTQKMRRQLRGSKPSRVVRDSVGESIVDCIDRVFGAFHGKAV